MAEKREAAKDRSGRDYVIVWAPVVLITLIGFLIAWHYVEPAPPDRIRIASGSEDGAYYEYAQRYRELLQAEGIQLDIVRTAGSIENLRLLSSGQVDLAFVQGGTASAVQTRDLESVASLYFEPLWVFHRQDLEINYLSDLKGRRIAIGPEGSGTRVLARELLEENGITGDDASLLALESRAAVEALRSGSVDAGFFVSGPRASAIRALLTADGLSLMSFQRNLAYTRNYRFLSTVILGEGGVDLVENIPPRDTVLLAPAAILVARNDLHPSLPPVILDTITPLHESGGVFEAPSQFPSSQFTEFPMNPEARRFLRSGLGFLYEVFPFWAASLIDRLKIMLLPFITLLVPLVRLAPPVYRWRIRSRIYRWYRVVREVDLKMRADAHSPGFREEIAQLNTLEAEIGEISVPVAYMEEFYNLRMHIDLLREKLEREASRE